MTSTIFRSLLVGAAMLAFTACNKGTSIDQKAAAPDNSSTAGAPASNDPIQSAEFAAPASIAKAAAIVEPSPTAR